MEVANGWAAEDGGIVYGDDERAEEHALDLDVSVLDVGVTSDRENGSRWNVGAQNVEHARAPAADLVDYAAF